MFGDFIPILIILGISMIAMSVGIVFKGKSIKGTCASAELVLEGDKEACNTCPLKTTEVNDD